MVLGVPRAEGLQCVSVGQLTCAYSCEERSQELRKGSPRVRKIIDMVAHRHEQVKEQFSPHLHLHLHGSTTLECFPAADDQSEVMSAQPRVIVRCVLVGIPSTAQNDADLDPALQALLAQRELLELLEAVAVGSTVHSCVTEDKVIHTGVEKGWLDSGGAVAGFVGVGRGHCTLEHPGLTALVVKQAGVVVTLVQILENAGENLRFLCRQVDASSSGLEELTVQRLREERGMGQDVFMRGKQSLVGTHDDCHDGRGQTW